RLQPARQRSADHFQLVTNERLNLVSMNCPGPSIPELREVAVGCGTGRIGPAQSIVNYYRAHKTPDSFTAKRLCNVVQGCRVARLPWGKNLLKHSNPI